MTTPSPEYFNDIHAHTRTGASILTSVRPSEIPVEQKPDVYYSVGIHPWDTAAPVTDEELQHLAELAGRADVAAIGETGLDALCGGDSAAQEAIFRRHAALAEEVGKFLIIHCVRRYGRLMELKRELHPRQRWIIHGFNGKPELARQLMAAGFELSLRPGERADALRALFPDVRFFNESDE